VTLLDPDAVWRADGGGRVRAVPQLARGAAAIARLLTGYARRPPPVFRAALVNGAPGLVGRDADGVLSVLALTVDGGRITAIDVIRDPWQADQNRGAARQCGESAGGRGRLAGRGPATRRESWGGCGVSRVRSG